MYHPFVLLLGIYLSGSSGYGYVSPSPGLSVEARQVLTENLVLVASADVERSVKGYVGDGWSWSATAGIEGAIGPVLLGASYRRGETVTSQYTKTAEQPTVAAGWRTDSTRTWLRYSLPDSTANRSRSVAIEWQRWAANRRARLRLVGGMGEFHQGETRHYGAFGSVTLAWAVWR